LDIDDYRKEGQIIWPRWPTDWAIKVKRTGHSLVIGPFNAHDRRIIHLTLKEDPYLKTESLGGGELKKVKIIPMKKEGYLPETLE